MNKRTVFFVSIFFLFQFSYISAQYPRVPKEVQDETNKMMSEATRLSDLAWEKALPIIEAEAKAGKPYIPWATRPTDLPQAKIPAFPGAEGGGIRRYNPDTRPVVEFDGFVAVGPPEFTHSGGFVLDTLEVVGL